MITVISLLLGEENSQRWFSAFPFPLKTLVGPLLCCQKLPECFSTARAPSVWSRTLVSALRFERQGGLFAFSASPTFQAIFCDVRQLLGLSLPYHTFFFQRVKIFFLSCALWVSDSELNLLCIPQVTISLFFESFCLKEKWYNILFKLLTNTCFACYTVGEGRGQSVNPQRRFLTSIKFQPRTEEKMSK